MTIREIKARYKNTFFGFLWAIVNPIIQVVIIGLIFKSILKDVGGNYYLHVYSGIIIWSFFSTTLNKTTPSFVYERALIRKSKFPYSVIPLSLIFSNFIHIIPSILIILFISAKLGIFTVLNLIYLLTSLSILLLFTVGLSLTTSVLNVRYRDISFFIQALLIIWFYATPIMYPLTLISNNLLWILSFNPLVIIIELFRYSIFNVFQAGQSLIVLNILIILFTFTSGIFLYHKHKKKFDDFL